MARKLCARAPARSCKSGLRFLATLEKRSSLSILGGCLFSSKRVERVQHPDDAISYRSHEPFVEHVRQANDRPSSFEPVASAPFRPVFDLLIDWIHFIPVEVGRCRL